MSKMQEFREKNDEDLYAREEELKHTIFKLRSTANIDKKDTENVKIRGYKKDIARIKTVLQERKIEQFLQNLSNVE